jgi:hypothetical protein
MSMTDIWPKDWGGKYFVFPSCRLSFVLKWYSHWTLFPLFYARLPVFVLWVDLSLRCVSHLYCNRFTTHT